MDKSKMGKINLEIEEVDDRQGFGDVVCSRGTPTWHADSDRQVGTNSDWVDPILPGSTFVFSLDSSFPFFMGVVQL